MNKRNEALNLIGYKMHCCFANNNKNLKAKQRKHTET